MTKCKYYRTCKLADKEGLTCRSLEESKEYCGEWGRKNRRKEK